MNNTYPIFLTLNYLKMSLKYFNKKHVLNINLNVLNNIDDVSITYLNQSYFLIYIYMGADYWGAAMLKHILK
jgi:hypothetical protein